jgi:hypothetical protein
MRQPVIVYLEPEERAVWQTLSDAETDDYLTVTEIAASVSKKVGRLTPESVIRETICRILHLRYVTRTPVYRIGRRQEQWGYRLTSDGRVCAARLLTQ